MSTVLDTTFPPGFYLVRKSDGMRFFITEDIDHRKFERVAERALNDRVGWDYWVDRCLGLDVKGAPAWVNLDWTDAFLAHGEVFSD